MDALGNHTCKSHCTSSHPSLDWVSSSGYSSDAISLGGLRQRLCNGPHSEMKSLLPCSDDKSVLRALGGLSPVLSCMRTITDSDDHYSDLKAPKLNESCFRFLRNEPCVKNGNGFCMAISLVDGNTLFVSNTITSVLGYPKDMVVGTCIMSYLYPRDRVTFASQLTQGLQSRFCDSGKNLAQGQAENTFYCRIRQYHGLKCGYGVSDKKNSYKPFQITIRVRDVASDESCVEDDVQTTCLIAVAVPLVSAYKTSEEIPAMSSFSTRHTSSCHFSHMDASAIPYLGFLPQDVLGFSIFDFYHMDDMPQLKEIYELVVKEQGGSFRSKPYRLKAFNGSYVLLETEWSCFINPWSRKLEFVLGQHRVLKGPMEANVFGENMKEDGVVSDEILKESQRIQEEIKTLLSQPVRTHVNENSRTRCPKRKRGLASFVSTLVDVCQGEERTWAKEDCSCSDHGSVVMGAISPHQEFNDSDPASLTPPTSQDLRFQENIDRYFATFSSGGSGGSSHVCSGSVESGKTSADSGNGSMPQQSEKSMNTNSNIQSGNTRASGGGIHEKYSSGISLTEELLTQHNRLIHKYNNKQRKVKPSSSTNVQLRKDNHRMKRSSSPHLPDVGSHKHNKPSKSRAANVPTQTESTSNPSTGHNATSAFNLNPPFSMGSFPSMSHTSSSNPWNSSSVTSSYTNSDPNPNPYTNPGVPNYGVPNYLYMGAPNANSAPITPSPFFMPVMYLGAMPFYPSIPPMMPQSTQPTMWPFNFGPACPMGMNVPVNQPQQPNQANTNVASQPPTTNGTNQATTAPTVDPKSPRRQNFENMDTNTSVPVENQGNQTRNLRSESICIDDKVNNNNQPMNDKVINSVSNVSAMVTGVTASTITTQSRIAPVDNLMCSAKENQRNFLAARAAKDDQRKADQRKADQEREQEKESQDDSASLSSSYLLKSDDLSSQSASDRAEEIEMDSKEFKKRPLLKDPPWMEGINMNPETIYRFQMPSRTLEEILKKDMKALQSMKQPDLVGAQLALLQSELDDEAREKGIENISIVEGQGDSEPQPGHSKYEVSLPSPTRKVPLGFDTLEEDTNEESNSREADMLLFITGPETIEEAGLEVVQNQEAPFGMESNEN